MKTVFVRACLLGVLAVTGACSPKAATIVPLAETPAGQCVQEVVLPKITEIKPAQVKPGSQVSFIGTGGYVRDSCGGISEGARKFKLYLDNEPIADISCYVNHCEGKFVLSSAIAPGSHCLGVQEGTCQLELEVSGD